jgi:hypothetical protein
MRSNLSHHAVNRVGFVQVAGSAAMDILSVAVNPVVAAAATATGELHLWSAATGSHLETFVIEPGSLSDRMHARSLMWAQRAACHFQRAAMMCC